MAGLLKKVLVAQQYRMSLYTAQDYYYYYYCPGLEKSQYLLAPRQNFKYLHSNFFGINMRNLCAKFQSFNFKTGHSSAEPMTTITSKVEAILQTNIRSRLAGHLA